MADLTRIKFTVSAAQADGLSGFLAIRVAHGWEEQVLPTGQCRATVHLPLPEVGESLVRDFSLFFPRG